MRFETLIEYYHDEIYRYLWRMLNSAGQSDAEVEAQDLTQEVFLRAYQAFGRLRRDSNHRAWLYKIASNCAYTALKKERREKRHNIPLHEEVQQISTDAKGSPDHQAILNEALGAAKKAIRLLPFKQQAAVVLRYVEGFTYSEIARALDCSQEGARANVSHGLRRLRRELKDEPF
jgi:RNA polymerase sigma-70 factor (ECF subfamily)